MDAAKALAGFSHVMLVHDHAAVAMLYAHEVAPHIAPGSAARKLVLFVDVGAVRAQASVVAYSSGRADGRVDLVEVLAAHIAHHCAGTALTAAVARLIVARVGRPGLSHASRLWAVAEKAKKDLSAYTEAVVSVDGLGLGGADVERPPLRLSRAELELEARVVAARIGALIREALSAASVDAHAIAEAQLVGGSSHAPLVQRVVQAELRAVRLRYQLNADDAVALGTGYVAAARLSRGGDTGVRIVESPPLEISSLSSDGECVRVCSPADPPVSRPSVYTVHLPPTGASSEVSLYYGRCGKEDIWATVAASASAAALPHALSLSLDADEIAHLVIRTTGDGDEGAIASHFHPFGPLGERQLSESAALVQRLLKRADEFTAVRPAAAAARHGSSVLHGLLQSKRLTPTRPC